MYMLVPRIINHKRLTCIRITIIVSIPLSTYFFCDYDIYSVQPYRKGLYIHRNSFPGDTSGEYTTRTHNV